MTDMLRNCSQEALAEVVVGVALGVAEWVVDG